jgi:hypothetical protein
MNLLSLCILSVNRIERCNDFVANINYQKNIFLQSLSLKNFFLFIFFFFILFIFLKQLKILKSFNKYILTFISLNFSLFLFFIIIYPSNIPFTDTWQEIHYLLNIKTIMFFQKNASGHPFYGFRFFHYILYKYFSLNYSVLHIINFIIYFFSCLLLFFYLNKFKNIYLTIIFLLILFSGKWLNILLEPVNIAWTINFILTITFVVILNLRDTYFKYIILSSVLLLAISNFGGGAALLIYFIIYAYFINTKYKIFALIPILFSVFFLIIFKYVNSTYFDPLSDDINIFNFYNLNFLQLLKNYLGLTSSVYFPYLIFIKPIYVLIGLIQNIIILYYIFLSKKNYLEVIKNLVVTNPFLIIGVIGCAIISIIRGDTFEQIRYFSFSIFFQLGFFIFILENNSKVFFVLKKKLFLFLIISLYFISILGPNTGLHFAILRAAIADKVNKCIILNTNSCDKMIYDLTFYKGIWYNYSDFEKSIDFLKKNKLSLFGI